MVGDYVEREATRIVALSTGVTQVARVRFLPGLG